MALVKKPEMLSVFLMSDSLPLCWKWKRLPVVWLWTLVLAQMPYLAPVPDRALFHNLAVLPIQPEQRPALMYLQLNVIILFHRRTELQLTKPVIIKSVFFLRAELVM